MILVTGATGHIGNVLVKELAKGDIPVRAFLLPNESIKSLTQEQIEIVRGDVTDYSSLQKAFRGVTKVFHLGSIAVSYPGNLKHMFDVNVNGLRNIITSCLEFDVKRLVYVNSAHAFHIPQKNFILEESKDFDPSKVKGLCSRSKAAAAKEFIDAVKKGLQGVMVHPSEVIGPYDYSLSHFDQMILNFMKGKIIPYVNGRFNFIDVRDTVKTIITASEKGIVGENYLLSGEQASLQEVFKHLEEIASIKSKAFKIPHFKAKWMSYFSDLYFMIEQKKPTYTPYSIYNLQINYKINCTKAENTLGFATRTLKQTLTDTVEWIKQKYL